MSSKSESRKNRRRVPRIERLERRELLAINIGDLTIDIDINGPAVGITASLPGFEFTLQTGQSATSVELTSSLKDFDEYEWTTVNDNAGWSPRAGLQVVELKNRLYLMGGRTPLDPAASGVPGASMIWNDVWRSRDQGNTWEQIVAPGTDGQWPARAYFQAVTKGRHIYVLGGQNFIAVPNPDPTGPPFISSSEFFNDVWRSRDGVNWTQVTSDAGWTGRAGLSSVVFKGEIYVLGGSFNDDAAVIGGPPERVYFNEVWKSRDGREWEMVTDNAPWAPRAGAQVVVKNGYMYLLGGEDGFTCDSQSRCPPYYNDVWRSKDGVNWELVTESADWSPRPGHQAVVLLDNIVLFGGFGLSADPADPFKPSNPMDVWVSPDGANWEQVSDSPWNATSPEEIKYDFDALAVWGGAGRFRPSILTFGGDRETFNFADPTNYLNVDNDVWRFSLPKSERIRLDVQVRDRMWQNPFNHFDVNGDEAVVPGDVLRLINELNEPAHHDPVSGRLGSPDGLIAKAFSYLDVSGDDHLTPLDPLLVVNYLNANRLAEVEAEGESKSEIELRVFSLERDRTGEPVMSRRSGRQATEARIRAADSDASGRIIERRYRPASRQSESAQPAVRRSARDLGSEPQPADVDLLLGEDWDPLAERL